MKMSKYKVSEPSTLKFLKANGAVVDENGNVVNDATDYWKKVYDQAEPKVAKYLHSDGTIDENPGSGGGGSDLEDNKTATIDVSAYTEPVEIEPTEGKDGMKKATVTLSNIPSGSGTNIIYSWQSYYTAIENPSVDDYAFYVGEGIAKVKIAEVGDDYIMVEDFGFHLDRTPQNDIDLNAE